MIIYRGQDAETGELNEDTDALSGSANTSSLAVHGSAKVHFTSTEIITLNRKKRCHRANSTTSEMHRLPRIL